MNEIPADFDRYVAEHNIPQEEWPEAFARWIAGADGRAGARFFAPGRRNPGR